MQYARSIFVSTLLSVCVSTALAEDKAGNEERPVRYWIERLDSDDAVTRKAATEALLANYDGIFEPPLFRDKDEVAAQERFRTELKLHTASLRKLLDCQHDESRETAAYLLAVIGPDAKDAEPALLTLIRSRTTTGSLKEAAITALLHVVPSNRPVGPTLLAVFNENAREAADKQLDAAEANAAQDDNDHEEACAGISATTIALMLAHSGRTATEVPTLVELITDKYRRGIRLTIMYALSEMESDCKAALPALRKLLSDDDRRIRSAAGWALLRIEGSLAELPAVLKAIRLDEKEEAEFQESISHLFQERNGWLRGEIDEMMPHLLLQVAFNNPFYQRQAIRFLG
jgi:HEAT repeat protein